MNVKTLRGGGVSDNGNSAVLEKARRALAAKKEICLRFPKAVATKKEDGRMDSAELAKYVNELASGAYEFILTVVRPFVRKLDQEIAEIGDEVRFDQCKNGGETKQTRREDYESTVDALLLFCPDNDGVLREEAGIPGRLMFVEALCLRVRHTTQIALLVDDFRHAENKNELEKLLSSAETDGKKVFARNSKAGHPIYAFGKAYELVSSIFGRYHEFACEKLGEAVSGRADELATAHREETKRLKQEVCAADDSSISPEELLFGDPEDVNEKTALFVWNFQKHENAIKVRRVNDRLYIVGALGAPLETLKQMQDEPFVVLKHIISEDGEHLCHGEMVGGKPKYDFGGFVHRDFLAMTVWVRTAAEACISPSRLLPGDKADAGGKKQDTGRKPVIKPAGELLTDQEFLYQCGLGEYDLVFKPGFHYEPRDENGNPDGRTFSITEEAVARVERKQVGKKKFKLAIKSSSTEELALLLEAGGAVVSREYFEGKKGSSLPIPIYLGIGQAFGRLKVSEAEAAS